MGQVLTVLPFRDLVEKVMITGSTLRKVLETSASKYVPDQENGAFLQVSGISTYLYYL